MRNDLSAFTSIVDIVRMRARAEPKSVAFRFLKYRPKEESLVLTSEALDARAKSIAAALQQHAQRGDRVLLLFRPGTDFVCAFLGCLYAGMVAVPSSVPRFGHGTERLRRIAANAGASIALSSSGVFAAIRAEASHIAPRWIEMEDIAETDTSDSLQLSSDDIAFLQYSSGSTGDPKGVVVTHANLMHQLALFATASAATRDSCMVSWLPVFHDLGLIAGVLHPLYSGFPGVLLAPESFVEKPERWLRAIASFRADMTAAPNFAYQLCARAISDQEMKGIDLASLRFALNGAEPIRPSTLERFAQRFSAWGFDPSAFYPAYGLAEATLLVTGGGAQGARPTVKSFNSQSLDDGFAVPVLDGTPGARCLAASGMTIEGQSVRIVDPEKTTDLGAMQVGEIWVSGQSVCRGYWQRSATTEETFGQVVAGQQHPCWLRTGDLGFLCDGELFVCGRLKDLLLIRGRNLHAPDIEATVETVHDGLRPNCGVAFPVDIEGEERLVVAHEVDREAKFDDERLLELAQSVAKAIALHHEVMVHAVVLLRHGTVPKTSSGKLQRREARQRFLQGNLKSVFSWSPPAPDLGAPQTPDAAIDAPTDQTRLQHLLVEGLAAILGVPGSEVDIDRPFAQYALDAAGKLRVVRLLESKLQRPLPATLLDDFKNIKELCETGQISFAGNGDGLSSDELVKAAAGAIAARPAGMVEDKIAIVGIGCRFPGAANPRDFWKLLIEGVDAVTEVPADRWDIDEVYDANPLASRKMNTRWGGFVEDIDKLDRNFFGLSIREAVRMDPQHRLMLEVAWEALEDAGIDPATLANTQSGVFVGISGSDYAQMQFGDASLVDAYAGLGCALTIAASRISHFLNLRGPAIAVDTACSSSLSALHLACVSLRRGECETALVGGVNILLSPVVTMCLTKAGMMSADGRCKAFDSRANGYVRAEGAGIVVLKPLSRAIADGNEIYAVVRGTASNQDGRSSGIAAPNGEAQQRVVLAACADAGIAPGQLDYVEAHGTGTSVGDPIEVKALGAVLSMSRENGRICPIGSVKTNIGHAESAAGIASVIKVALMLKHRMLPPSLHFVTPNPLIPFDDLPLRVQRTAEQFPDDRAPLLAGVNGFGVGGTNVHAVLEEAPSSSTSELPGNTGAGNALRPYLLLLSARSAASLRGAARRLAQYLGADGVDRPLAGVAHTLAVRRSAMNHSLGIIGEGREELMAALSAYAEGLRHPGVLLAPTSISESSPKLAFVFSGQGSQWWGMGRKLLQCEPVFQSVIARCDQLLSSMVGWSLLDVLHANQSDSRLTETAFAQPALFALQAATVALWKSWGVTPDAVVGHSVGEIAAAHAAGALTLDDSIALVAHRAALMQQATGLGSMVSVETSLEEAEAAIDRYRDRLAVAAVNSPGSIVLSGDTIALDEVISQFKAKGTVTVKLPVNYAFHSPQVEPFKEALCRAVADLRPGASSIPMMSTVTGDWCSGETLVAGYWGENMRGRVNFAQAIARLAEEGFSQFVEVGPHPVLCGSISRTLKSVARAGSAIPSLIRDKDDQTSMLSAWFELRSGRRNMETCQLFGNWPVERSVPGYAWDRQRYWLDLPNKEVSRSAIRHPLVTSRLQTAQPAWQSLIDAHQFPGLRGPRRAGDAYLSRGVFVELAMAAATAMVGEKIRVVKDLVFDEQLMLPMTDAYPELQTTLLNVGPDEAVVTVHVRTTSAQGGGWHRQAELRTPLTREAPTNPARIAIDQLKSGGLRRIEGDEIYRLFGQLGLEYPNEIRLAKTAWVGNDESLLQLAMLDSQLEGAERYCLHPIVFEAMEQTLRIALGARGARAEMRSARRFQVVATGSSAWVHAKLRSEPDADGLPRVDLCVCDNDGNVIAVAEGVSATNTTLNEVAEGVPTDPGAWLYQVDWVQTLPLRQTSDSDAGAWLILADERGVARRIAKRLTAAGQRCISVRRGACQSPAADDEIGVLDDSADSLREAFVAALGSDECRGVIHLWCLDHAEAPPTFDTVLSAQKSGALSVMHLVQALAQLPFRKPPRLWIVTSGVQRIQLDSADVRPTHATVWGLGKSISIEHPELRCTRVDLGHAMNDVREISALAAELLADEEEDQLAFREEHRYVARLARYRPATGDASAEAQAGSDAIPATGSYRVDWPIDAQTPMISTGRSNALAPHEVEIEVEAIAAEGDALVRGLGVSLSEFGVSHFGCAGRIKRVGHEVNGWAAGDRVAAFAHGGMASQLCVPESALARLPENTPAAVVVGRLRPALAASIALRELSTLTPGDRVLIHGADTEAGAIAVAMAVSLGGRVVATAADPLVREHLTNLGASVCLDSASISFYSALHSALGRAGARVCLNLSDRGGLGELQAMVSPFGHCIDLSGCLGRKTAGTRHVRVIANASLHVVDLECLFDRGSALTARIMQDATDWLYAVHMRLGPPSEVCLANEWNPIRQAAREAVAIAPLVVKLPDRSGEQSPTAVSSQLLRDDGTYLVTGGLGGLGLSIALRLTSSGAKHLVLMGRKAPTQMASEVISEIERRGVEVRTVAADVADREAMIRLLSTIRSEMPPLRGIVHAAGSLDNALMVGMSDAQFMSPLPSKVLGAYLLDTLTADDPLDFFVMFSSLASLIGSPGQGNYGAANAYLDALACMRSARGQPGLAICWGPWAEIGMAADAHNASLLEQYGMGMLAPEKCLDLFENFLLTGTGVLGAIAMDWSLWSKSFPALSEKPFMSLQVPGKDGKSLTAGGRLTAAAIAAVQPDEQMAALISAIHGAVCRALQLAPEQLTTDIGLTAVGLDSIVALELKNRIESSIDVVVQTPMLLKGPTIEELAVQFRSQLLGNNSGDASKSGRSNKRSVTRRQAVDLLERLDELSDEEVNAILTDLSDGVLAS